MNALSRQLILQWITGALIGTAIIAITSPLFVRSYLPLQTDPVRGVWTLSPNQTYRWRSEGYADTQIGPLGMPGKTFIGPRSKNVIRVALWGDSQAEGVCVADHQKIFARADQLGQGKIEVFPLARSGEDMDDWLTQISAVETELDIDAHVFLIVDLPDLLSALDAPLPPPDPSQVAQPNSAIASRFPAFVIQAARNLLTQSDDSTRRTLRFAIGPVASPVRPGGEQQQTKNNFWYENLTALKASSNRPLTILYAPKIPQILNGNVVQKDRHENDFLELQLAAEQIGIPIADVRPDLLQSAAVGRWPHGFHNGLMGSGHLNEIGNQIVAAQVVGAISASQGN
jgi:hypothetical protein